MMNPRLVNVGNGPQVHGSLDQRAKRSMPKDWIDLAVNTNPFGPAPSVLGAIRAAEFDAYPEDRATSLRERWAAAIGVTPAEILFGGGAVELIWAVVRAFTGPGRALLVVGPTFSEAEHAAAAAGAPVVHLHGQRALGWQVDEGAVRAAIDDFDVPIGLVYVCAPNNPTGHLPTPASLAAIDGILPDGARWLVDESFATLMRGAGFRDIHGAESGIRSPCDLSAIERPVLRIRSLTKDNAIPGARLGFLLGAAEGVERVATQLPPWSVAAGASAAGHAILEAPARDWLRWTGARWAEATVAMESALEEYGWVTARGHAPFLLIHVGRASVARAGLLEDGVHVRDASSFGLPGDIRVAGRDGEELDRLLKGLARLRTTVGLSSSTSESQEMTP